MGDSLKVVVASPGDVQAERKALSAVRDRLNKGIAKERNVQIELFLWETDAYPGFHPEGPQGLIDGILPFKDCDVLLGIFWKRFDTPTVDAESGTEHEIRQAYEAWQKQRRPQIMLYFNQKSASPQTPEEAIQWSQVLEFYRQFSKKGLVWTYKGKAQFVDLVSDHPTRFIQQLPSPAVSSRRKNTVASTKPPTAQTTTRKPTTHIPISPELAESMRAAYLTTLMDQVRAVPLSGVDRKSI